MSDAPSYRPTQFWEKSHSSVGSADVKLGRGVQHVGGGHSPAEADALYRLRNVNAQRIFKKCQTRSNPRIFELGSGGGYWVDFFQRFKPEIFVGSDLAQTAVDRLSATYPEYKFIGLTSQDAWLQMERLGPYDITLAIDVLYHITDDETWMDALNRLCANTVKSGLLIIADYFYEQPTDQPSKIHVKHRRMQDYLDVLDKHGFAVQMIQPVFYFLNRIVDGPWRDHTKVASPILRLLSSNKVGLWLLQFTDIILTSVLRPMSPKSKTRFLVVRKTVGR